MTTETETPHHPRGPSRLPALARCVWNESKPAGPAAERGTRIHARIAEALSAGMVCLRADESDIAPLVETALGAARRELAVIEGTEELLELRDTDGHVLTFGTMDAFGRNAAGELTVLDWKTGAERDHREQAAAYALLAMDAAGENEANAVFCYLDQGTTKAERFTRTQAEKIVMPILERAETKAEPPAINPYCGWCARRPSCPAWTTPALSAVGAIDPELAALFAGGLDKIATDPERAGKFLSAWRAAEAVVEDSGIAAAVKSTLTAGEFVPGWKLQARKGRQSIEAGEYLRILPKLGDAAAKFIKVEAGPFLKWWRSQHKDAPPPLNISTAEGTTALVPITPGAPGSEE